MTLASATPLEDIRGVGSKEVTPRGMDHKVHMELSHSKRWGRLMENST